LPALADRRRSERPARFTPVQVAEAKALACQLPAETGGATGALVVPDYRPGHGRSAHYNTSPGAVR
jgi:hypothetical protein